MRPAGARQERVPVAAVLATPAIMRVALPPLPDQAVLFGDAGVDAAERARRRAELGRGCSGTLRLRGRPEPR
jgi:hypothetical protein